MKVAFEELTPNVQERILSLLETRLVYKGEQNARAEAIRLIGNKQPKTRKQWRGKIYHYMTSIDRHRKRMGLEPIYNCDLTLSTGGDKVAMDIKK